MEDNYINLKSLRKPFRWIFAEALVFPQCNVFNNREKGRKLLVFDRETFLNFFVFLTSKCYYTGVNGENDMLVRYINSCGINRLTSLCILCFQMANHDAKS